MIAEAAFGAPSGGIRTLRFSRRASIPLAAACAVANGLRAALHELFGDGCDLVVGEPAAIGSDAWALLAGDALLFLTRGRPSDVVLVLPNADARRLVLRAFGESGDGLRDLPGATCSVLERHALERIAARCAAAFDPVCTQRESGSRAIGARELPDCVAYFDVRIRRPIELTLGVGLVRDLPDPAPSATLDPEVLESVGLEVRAVFAEGRIETSALASLAPGDIVKLDTKVGAQACLNVAASRVAIGIPGVVASRNAVCVRDVPGVPLQ